jgi:hypothetical protein
VALSPTSSRGTAGAASSQLAYVEFTSSVTISATTEGTAQDVVSSGAVTYAAVATIIEFSCPVIEPVTFATPPGIFFILQDGATVLGRLAFFGPGAAVQSDDSPRLSRQLTPSAGSHTYKVTAYRLNQNWTVAAGSGGTGAYVPGYIRVYTA